MDFLVVEDDELAARAIRRALKTHGSVTIASSVSDAKRALQTHEPHAVIVDVGLPDGSGFDVVRHARAKGSNVPALILTGRSGHEIANTAFDLCVEFLVKPFESSQLEGFVLRARAKRETALRRLEAAVLLTRNEFGLTSRETEILHLATNGTDRTLIATTLGCEESTVKSHINNLLKKTRHISLPDAAIDVLRRLVNTDV